VFNIIGQKVHEEQVPEQAQRLLTLDLSSLSNGIYSVRIEIEQQYLFARVLLIQD